MQNGFRLLSEEIYEMLYTKAPMRIQRSNLANLTLFSRSQRPFKMVYAQYVNKYLTYPYQIWYTQATGQEKRLVKFLKVALSYSGDVSPTVAIKRAYF